MSIAPETKLVVFDLDGTLVPTMHHFADIAADVIATRRGWERERARRGYIDTCGNPFAQQLEALFPGHADNAAAAEEFEQRKLRVFYESAMEPAVLGALRTLQEAGYRLAVSSNNFESLVHGMIRREAPGLFDPVLGFREGFAKGPDHFDALWRGTGLGPERALFVGDSLSDLDKARRAGTRFVGISGTFTRADFERREAGVTVLASVADLPAWLGVATERPAPLLEDLA